LKDDIHPEYVESTISCACGNAAVTRATIASMHVDICSKCHPFFTGKAQRLLDRGGRIEQFNRRYSIKDAEAALAEAEEAVEA
jgi:large subunit ribosomal protein L31